RRPEPGAPGFTAAAVGSLAERALDHRGEVLDLEGLLDEPAHALVDDALRRLVHAVAGAEDRLDTRNDPLPGAEALAPIQTRPDHVDEDDVDLSRIACPALRP